MAVLLTYHKLVERDSKNIDIQWKGANNNHNFVTLNRPQSSFSATSIILLVFAVICSFGVSFSLDKIILAYDSHCVLGAVVKFKDNSTTSLYYGKSAFQDRINRTETLERLESQPVTKTKKFVLLSDFFNETYAKTLLDDFETKELPIEQVQFLVNSKLRDLLFASKYFFIA